tara:strand:- start:1836 stop:3908 length:2073 start_codon:yes stop_codon:yes gene_type:complete
MDNYNFKTNFIGKDGFVWWIGQVAPNDSWIKNFEENKELDTELAKAWGIRYKVRIMGYHPYSNEELKDKDLPWAQVLTAAGNSGSLNTRETVRLNGGDIVVGFFLDGHNAQVPMIMGSFTHTKQWDEEIKKWKESGAPPSAFGVFGGYSKAFEEANYAINKTNSHESDGTGEGGPKDKSVENAVEQDGTSNTVNETNGLEINLCDKGPVSDIKNDVKDMVSQIQSLKARMDDGNEFFRDKVKDIVSSTTESVVRKSGKLVSGMIDDTFNKIAPIGRTGLDKLYKGVYSKVLAATKAPPVAHIAGVAAQTAMLAPLSVAENLIGCLANNIIADLGGMTEDILNSVVDNVFNVTDCVSDQVVGAITNGIVGKVGDGMSGALGGLDKILGFFGGGQGGGFNVENIIRNSTSSIAGAVGLRGCNEPIKTDELGPCKYRLGYGPVSAGDADLKNILGNANAAAAISSAAALTGFPLDGIQDIAGALDIFNSDMKVPGFKSSISNCYSGLPTLCEPPKIRIFGGGGSGAEAIPIFGNIIGDTRYRTGSIIDIKLTNPGNGYQYPPFVEIVDNCNQGVGAQARATIKDGKVVNLYIITEGENYPVSDQPEVVITDINIVNPGQNYNDGDTVTDNIGNEYDVTIQNGAIIKVRPLTNIAVEETVQLSINTSTGFDALIFATLGDRPDGEVTQVIDCIS